MTKIKAEAPLPPIVVFGIGNAGRSVGRSLRRQGIPITAFLDNLSGEGEFVLGAPVYNPCRAPSEISRGRAIVLFCVLNPELPLEDIASHLRNAGWEQVMSVAEFCRRYRESIPDLFWGVSPAYYEHPETLDAINEIRGIWADEASAKTFEALLAVRKHFDPSYQMGDSRLDTYFPPGIKRWKEPMRLVDGGSFDASILSGALRRGYHVEAAALFEPDAANLSRIAGQWIGPDASMGLHAPILCWPCAICDRDATLCFRSDGDMTSAVGDGGESRVPGIRLDTALWGFKPTLIKLDVEGSEIAALEGARGIIQKDRPAWAISAYHLADDLWEIPRWFQKNAARAGYRYYLRDHYDAKHDLDCPGVFEHVFYAVPS